MTPRQLHQCENGHIGPFVYEGEEEWTGLPYVQERHEFVTLTCQNCWTETQRLTVHDVADLLNQLVQLPTSKVNK